MSYPQPVDVPCVGAVSVLLWPSVFEPNLNDEDLMHLAIAGNIGSGKTTLTTLLAKHYRYTPHFEQVDDNPYLNDFYKDMTRWSFNLQIYFLRSRFAQLIEMKKKGKPIDDACHPYRGQAGTRDEQVAESLRWMQWSKLRAWSACRVTSVGAPCSLCMSRATSKLTRMPAVRVY